MKYRCSNHAHIRREANRGFDLDGNKISQLKPHWETEDLSDEQFAIEKSGMKMSQHEGYLAQEQAGLEGYRRNIVISWALEKWSEENQEQSNILAKLQYERNTVARATEEDLVKYPSLSVGDPLPTWAGMPKFSGAGGNRKRDSFIQSMNEEQRKEYKSTLDTYMEIFHSRGKSISLSVKEWVDSECQWPYQKMEKDWEDWTDSFSHLRDNENEVAWDEGNHQTILAIQYDLKCLEFGSKVGKKSSIPSGLSISELRKSLNQ